MHSHQRENLLKKIIGILKRTELNEGEISDTPISDILKLPLGKLNQWITEEEFSAEIINAIHNEIHGGSDDEFPNLVSGNLQSAVGESVVNDIANQLVDKLSRLPYKYYGCIALPKVVSKKPLHANYKFMSLDSEPRSIKSLFGSPNNIEYPIKIRVEASGYANYTLESSAAVEALYRIKVILQSWIASGIVEINKLRLQSGGLLFNATKGHVIDKLHIVMSTAEVKRDRSPQLPIDLTVVLLSMQLSKSFRSHDELVDRLINISTHAVDLLAMHTEEARSICAAAEWLFNSYLSENETISFLQVCFGFEALFGDGESASVTKTLANRCAFAVATRVSERAGIIIQFTKFYEMRSKIVHGKVARLDKEARAQLSWARSLLQIAIQSEMARI